MLLLRVRGTPHATTALSLQVSHSDPRNWSREPRPGCRKAVPPQQVGAIAAVNCCERCRAALVLADTGCLDGLGLRAQLQWLLRCPARIHGALQQARD